MYLPTPDEQAALAAMNQPPPDTSGLTIDPSQAVPMAAAPIVAPQPQPQTTPPPAPVQAPPMQVATAALNPYGRGVTNFESGGDPNATNPITGAHGQYQFLPSTFKSVIAAHPELAGLSDSDPRVLAAFTQDNAKILTSELGHAPSQMELMAAHFLGAGGAVTFLKALAANPNSSVEGVVSKAALDANRGVFYNADGSAKTLSQVYNETATKVGAASSAGATGAPGQPGANPYAQQGSDINSFIAGQPGMWAKLQAMQDQYKKAAQPTWQQKMEDAINGMQQQQAVADSNMHANAGAIMTHSAQPDASQFVSALQATHNMNVAERMRDQDFAKTNYEMGASTLQAKNALALQNLGLTGGLATSIAGYGVEQRKLAQGDTGLGIQQQQATTAQQNADTEKAKVANDLSIAMLKYPTEQAKAFQDILEKQVPDPNAQAAILKQFIAAGGNPSAALPANLTALNKIISAYTATNGTPPTPNPDGTTPPPTGGGSVQKPGKQLQVTWFDPATGQPQRKVVDENNPSDQNWMRTQKPPNATTVDLASPTTTVNTGSGGEGGAGSGLADQHLQAITLKQASDTALSLLPYIQQHGGTGVLTGTDGTLIANGIKQATGIDVTGIPVREVLNKLLNQVQTGLVLPSMKMMGSRPTGAEFDILRKGQIGDTATVPALTAFLKHTSDTADWTQRQIEAQSDAAMQAKRNNNPYFDSDNARINWQKQPGNQPPVWNGQDLIDEVEKKNPSQPAATQPPNPNQKVIGGVTYNRDPTSPSGWSQQ